MGSITYRKDPEGEMCPIGAHIRRANPGDSLDKNGTRSRRHRLLLRRGVPYVDPDAPDDAPAAGLLFMAFCTHIDRQFEFVRLSWLNDGNVFGLVNQPDPVFSGQDGMVVRVNPKVNTPGAAAGDHARRRVLLHAEQAGDPGNRCKRVR